MSTQGIKSIYNSQIIEEYHRFLRSREFPCIGAKAALSRDQVKCMVASDMSTSQDDESILTFIYQFVDSYRNSTNRFIVQPLFSVILSQRRSRNLKTCLVRLNSFAELDRKKYLHDKRVNSDPTSGMFSFSLKEEAFFIIGLHSSSSREAEGSIIRQLSLTRTKNSKN